MTKRIIIVLMLLALVSSLCIIGFAAGGSLSANGGAACPGNTVEVSFWISGNSEPGIVGAELRGSYDASKLEYVSFSNGSVIGSPVCNVSGGSIYVSWDESLTTGVVGDGEMCTLTFRIREDCAPGQQLHVSVTSFRAHDTNLNDVTFSASSTSVTVREHSWSAPTYTWSDDNTTCTARRTQSCGCGGQESETVTAEKEENGNTTTYTAHFQNTAFETQTKQITVQPQPQPNYISVTFRLIGATLSKLENGVDLSNGGTSDSRYETWIPTKWYTMDAGSTAYDLIARALNGAGLSYDMSSYYLSSVNAPAVLGGYELAELTNGSRSGWMFTVNGSHGQLSISQQQLQNGDEIIVHYINDYIYEENSYTWLSAPDTAPVQHRHSYASVVTAPTCTAEGYTTHTCTCGDSYVDEKVEATGHSWGEGAVTVEPTETSAGEKTYTCSVCGETRNEEIAPLVHTHQYDAVVTAATCTAEGYTTHTCTCGDSYVDEKVEATGHSWDEGTVTVEPTEISVGKKTFVCIACGETKAEELASLEHTHKYIATVTSPTCAAEGYTTYNCFCGDSYVDQKVDALTHTYGQWEQTRAPSYTESGEEQRQCSACNHIETRSVILRAPMEGDATDPGANSGTPSGDAQECICWVCDKWYLIVILCITSSLLLSAGISVMLQKTKKLT